MYEDASLALWTLFFFMAVLIDFLGRGHVGNDDLWYHYIWGIAKISIFL